MTTKQADKIINDQKPVTVHNAFYRETFTATFVRRDRHLLYSADGGVFERKELEIVETTTAEPEPEEDQHDMGRGYRSPYWQYVS